MIIIHGIKFILTMDEVFDEKTDSINRVREYHLKPFVCVRRHTTFRREGDMITVFAGV